MYAYKKKSLPQIYSVILKKLSAQGANKVDYGIWSYSRDGKTPAYSQINTVTWHLPEKSRAQREDYF